MKEMNSFCSISLTSLPCSSINSSPALRPIFAAQLPSSTCTTMTSSGGIDEENQPSCSTPCPAVASNAPKKLSGIALPNVNEAFSLCSAAHPQYSTGWPHMWQAPPFDFVPALGTSSSPHKRSQDRDPDLLGAAFCGVAGSCWTAKDFLSIAIFSSTALATAASKAAFSAAALSTSDCFSASALSVDAFSAAALSAAAFSAATFSATAFSIAAFSAAAFSAAALSAAALAAASSASFFSAASFSAESSLVAATGALFIVLCDGCVVAGAELVDRSVQFHMPPIARTVSIAVFASGISASSSAELLVAPPEFSCFSASQALRHSSTEIMLDSSSEACVDNASLFTSFIISSSANSSPECASLRKRGTQTVRTSFSASFCFAFHWPRRTTGTLLPT
mmetsp:Transcript_11511/g.18866  ORF Transcript_11511/g.18866 Transcript_11511/m.18866 type:complete len:394 (+) Transcript_11511:992-2173(+)